MIDMSGIYARVSAWNAERYDRVYNKELAVALLSEELTEYFTANNEVEALDGLVDTAYVAFGIIWKLNVTDEELQQAMYKAYDFAEALPSNMLTYAAYAAASVTALQYSAPALQMACNIIVLCMLEAQDTLRVSFENWVEACFIVCDSNDSKVVMKVDSAVKANAGNKGSNFIDPKPFLAKLLAKRKLKGV